MWLMILKQRYFLTSFNPNLLCVGRHVSLLQFYLLLGVGALQYPSLLCLFCQYLSLYLQFTFIHRLNYLIQMQSSDCLKFSTIRSTRCDRERSLHGYYFISLILFLILILLLSLCKKKKDKKHFLWENNSHKIRTLFVIGHCRRTTYLHSLILSSDRCFLLMKRLRTLMINIGLYGQKRCVSYTRKFLRFFKRWTPLALVTLWLLSNLGLFTDSRRRKKPWSEWSPNPCVPFH